MYTLGIWWTREAIDVDEGGQWKLNSTVKWSKSSGKILNK